MTKCGNCGKRTDNLNPPIILKPMTGIGYQEIDFCTKDCFKEYIKKRYKLVELQ